MNWIEKIENDYNVHLFSNPQIKNKIFFESNNVPHAAIVIDTVKKEIQIEKKLLDSIFEEQNLVEYILDNSNQWNISDVPSISKNFSYEFLNTFLCYNRYNFFEVERANAFGTGDWSEF